MTGLDVVALDFVLVAVPTAIVLGALSLVGVWLRRRK